MDEDFTDGFDTADVCDIEPADAGMDFETDDIGDWMNDAPEVEDISFEEMPEYPEADDISSDELDLAVAMDEAADDMVEYDDFAEPEEEIEVSAEEFEFPQETEDAPEEPEIAEEFEDVPEEPEVAEEFEDAPEEPEIAGEFEDAPEEPEVAEEFEDAPEEPEITEEFEDVPEEPEVAEEFEDAPEEPEVAEEFEDAPEEPEIAGEFEDAPPEPDAAEEIEEAPEVSEADEDAGDSAESDAGELTEEEVPDEFVVPDMPPPPLPGQQELIEDWMEGESEDASDTLEDDWGLSTDTEETSEADDTVAGSEDEASAEDAASGSDGAESEEPSAETFLPQEMPLSSPDVPEDADAETAEELPPPEDTADLPDSEDGLLDVPEDVAMPAAPGGPGEHPNSPDNVTGPGENEDPLFSGSGDLPPEEVGDVSDATELTPLQQMSEYMNRHNYGKDDFSTYCQDPEWQRLNNQLLREQEIPPTAEEQRWLYMAEHNYSIADYPTYSQDPEWQRLNAACEENGDIPISVLPYEDRIDAVIPEQSVDTPDLPETAAVSSGDIPDGMELPADAAELPADAAELPADAAELPADAAELPAGYYTQGNNEFGYEGTCGPTSIANSMNRLLGTSEFSENDVLTQAIQKDLCDHDLPDAADCGGTTTDQFVELYEHMNEMSGGKLDIQRYDFENVLTMEEVAQALDNGSVVNVAVDSATLWGESADGLMGTLDMSRATDHWITVTGVERGDSGEITGFHIIDSGGGVDFVDAGTYQRMCYGDEELHLTDPTCIVARNRDTDLSVQPPVTDLAETAGAVGVHDLREESAFFENMDGDALAQNQAAMDRLSEQEREVYRQALDAEPAVTQDIQDVSAAVTGSELAGLEYRIKTPASLEGKLYGREEAADIENVSDLLRYTQTFRPEDLVRGANESLALYEQKGYTVAEVKNTWTDPNNPYNGINVKLISPTNQKLEVQFHTPESYELKNGPMHQLYEQWRALPEDSDEALELQNRMFALVRNLKMPQNISEVRKK